MASTGGREARRLRFCSEAELSGHLLNKREEPLNVDDDPEVCLSLVERLFEDLLKEVTGSRSRL